MKGIELGLIISIVIMIIWLLFVITYQSALSRLVSISHFGIDR